MLKNSKEGYASLLVFQLLMGCIRSFYRSNIKRVREGATLEIDLSLFLETGGHELPLTSWISQVYSLLLSNMHHSQSYDLLKLGSR